MEGATSKLWTVIGPPKAVVAIEFESIAKAKEWYNSPEYQAILPKRLNTTKGGVVFVDEA